jgi:phage-related baseplate assembly protein
MADELILVPADVVAEQAAIIEQYETLTGRTVNPADTEMFIFNTLAYQITLARSAANHAAKQNLLDYSIAPVIDYLGALLGVIRLAATGASVTLDFVLPDSHTGVTIVAGTRVQSTDGKAIFATNEDVVVTAAVTSATVTADCITPGLAGNGFAVGTITNILDPQPYLSSATNSTESAGGADQETDDELRARIKLAPAQFTTAGSRASYIYHAFTASAAIIDVAVLGAFPIPGSVSIYPLLEAGGVTPAPILALVEAACNAETVRPLCDTVIVASPTQVNYDLYADYAIYEDADADATKAAADEAINAILVAKRQKLGADIVLEQLTNAGQVDGMYAVKFYTDALLTTPFTTIGVLPTEFAECGTFVSSIGDITEG